METRPAITTNLGNIVPTEAEQIKLRLEESARVAMHLLRAHRAARVLQSEPLGPLERITRGVVNETIGTRLLLPRELQDSAFFAKQSESWKRELTQQYTNHVNSGGQIYTTLEQGLAETMRDNTYGFGGASEALYAEVRRTGMESQKIQIYALQVNQGAHQSSANHLRRLGMQLTRDLEVVNAIASMHRSPNEVTNTTEGTVREVDAITIALYDTFIAIEKMQDYRLRFDLPGFEDIATVFRTHAKQADHPLIYFGDRQ